MTKVAINGFGRIGRMVLRAALAKKAKFDVVAVNDLADASDLAYLFKYDSVHGKYKGEVKAEGDTLIIDGHKIKVIAQRDPAQLPWKEMGIDIVIESTGRFEKREDAEKHIQAGAKKVIISAPAKNEDITIVMGVNNDKYDPKAHNIISNASCTTNALAPLAKVLQDNFGIKQGFMNTTHAYTSTQAIHDMPIAKDRRRGRAAAINIVPASTGAAKAISLVLPELKGKLDGLSLRTPNPDGSIVDLTVVLEKNKTREEVDAALKKASETNLKGILEYNDEEIVSSDIIGNAHSSILDAKLTMVIGNMVKVLGWYDNEWGYSNRVVDLTEFVASKGV
jgi:glyceraldehyde 3-phosphate dehydrogenase